MAAIKLPETTEWEFMEAVLVGEQDVSYRPYTATVHLWKCSDCGLVWPTQHQAENCPARKHRVSYVTYHGGYFENGVHKGGTEFVRQAIRRDPVKRSMPVPKPREER